MEKQEHQEYIQQKVNPILENLVTQLLLERPENLSPFMIKWLSEQAKTKEAAALIGGVNELTDLKSELELLQKEVQQLEEEVGGDVPKQEKPDGDDKLSRQVSESEEEDDDEDAPDLPPPPAYMARGPRASVSAEAYGAWNEKKEFEAPVYPKTDAQKSRIQDVLKTSFLFSSLGASDMTVVIGAMQEKVLEEGARLIEQGDDGDCLYVVEEGQMNCFKKIDGEEKLVKECKAGDAFGELALLYNCPRAASVAAHSKCVLWLLDRQSFNHIVKDAAQKRRERYEEFLKKVPLLQTIDAYERTSMCDALESETVAAGINIVNQGEKGDKFYILEEGEAVCFKTYVKDTPAKEVTQYKSGDYFGELGLLHDEGRAATVTAKTECKVLTVSRRTFKNILGPLEDILLKNSAAYK